jgi:hypothetical protein
MAALMTPKERELLQGMCNCYSVCGEEFERTVEMVSHARGLTANHVKSVLREISAKYSKDPEYTELRKGFPPDSPE